MILPRPVKSIWNRESTNLKRSWKRKCNMVQIVLLADRTIHINRRTCKHRNRSSCPKYFQRCHPRGISIRAPNPSLTKSTALAARKTQSPNEHSEAWFQKKTIWRLARAKRNHHLKVQYMDPTVNKWQKWRKINSIFRKRKIKNA